MIWIIETAAETREFSIPDGCKLEAEPIAISSGGASARVLIASFENPSGEVVAVFTNLTAIYPASTVPSKDEFANAIPDEISWARPGHKKI